MKSIAIYITLAACLCAFAPVTAQPKEYKGKIGVTPLQLTQIGDSLIISIDFDLRDVIVKSRRSISLIPVLVAYNRERNLPEVQVKGLANYLTSKREIALMSRNEKHKYEQNTPYAIVKGYKSGEQRQVLYRKAIVFESWMKDARMDIREDLSGCGTTPRLIATLRGAAVQLEPTVLPYEMTPHIAYVQPIAEAVKRRERREEVFLNFVVSKIDIRPDYMNNPRELKRITDMVKEFESDSSITVKAISVEGYASPEGALKFNQWLSEGRANALIQYIIPRFKYPQNMYSIAFGGENWAGLKEAVSLSDLPEKQLIISIIDNPNINRKGELIALNRGDTYRYMLKKYYPSLRKAVCKIDYQVQGFEVDHAKVVFETHPHNLSLSEMYLVANTYNVGSKEFNNLFETAVRLFPNDVTANLNAASAALACKDLKLAMRYLERIKGKIATAEYHNALGVMLMLNSNYDGAAIEFQIASRAGLEAAASNLNELEIKAHNSALIDKQQSRYKLNSNNY